MAQYCTEDSFEMLDTEDEFRFWSGGDGIYFTPSVSEDGTLSWTNNAGLTNPAPVNIFGYSSLPAKNATPGAAASFPDGAYDAPLADLRIGIEPVQSGSGDPSPDNVRPISGWSAARIEQSQKNLLKNDWIGKSRTAVGMTVTGNADGSLTFNGTATASGVIIWSLTDSSATSNAMAHKGRAIPPGRYIVSGMAAGFNLQVRGSNIYGGSDDNYIFASTGSREVTLVIDDTYQYNWIRIQISNGYTADNLTLYPMIRLASDPDSAYEPYNGKRYSVSFGEAGTVYGGTLDVLTGVLTVEMAMVDLGTLTWSAVSNERYDSAGIASVVKLPNSATVAANIVCSAYTTASNVDVYNRAILNSVAINASGHIMIYDTTYGSQADTTAFKAAVDGVQLIFELATPLTYQLDPVTITSLLGSNTLWADCGDIERLVYRADPGMVLAEEVTAQLAGIRSMLAYVESEMTATRNYTTGDYIVVGNNYYKVTANIANGGSIAVGVNVQNTTVGAQLTQINSQI